MTPSRKRRMSWSPWTSPKRKQLRANVFGASGCTLRWSFKTSTIGHKSCKFYTFACGTHKTTEMRWRGTRRLRTTWESYATEAPLDKLPKAGERTKEQHFWKLSRGVRKELGKVWENWFGSRTSSSARTLAGIGCLSCKEPWWSMAESHFLQVVQMTPTLMSSLHMEPQTRRKSTQKRRTKQDGHAVSPNAADMLDVDSWTLSRTLSREQAARGTCHHVFVCQK